jgi:3-oxoacyl-[acyl-carrier protein] reductase
MDLGIAGRKAIVCASSKGLGRACAEALARAGCEVVINGRNAQTVEATAAELRQATGAKITGIAADVGTPDGQKALLAACPEPDILINNNSGPPFRDFRRKFGRIVNITSGTVKMPLAGLDLSSGARAGLTAFLAGVARSVVASNVTINFMLPGAFDTERLRSNIDANAKKQGISYEAAATQRVNSIPAKRFGETPEFGATCAFLCSAHAGFITGQNILLDGGAYPGTF